MLTPGVEDLKATSCLDDYEIDFNVTEALYQKSIDLFELKSRYNHHIEKLELLKWCEKRKMYPDSKVQKIADDLMIPFGEMFEELFELDFRRRKHYPKEKARRDVMLID